MRRMRQLTLDTYADTGDLTLVSASAPVERDISPVDTTKAYILRLPQELVVTIFEAIYSDTYGYWGDATRQTFSALALVHPLFRNAASMFLYRTADISILPGKKSSQLLRRSLQENRSLGEHVRHIRIGYGDYCYVPKSNCEASEDLEMLQDIVKHSNKTRELYIHCRNSPKSPLVLSNILCCTIPKLPFMESFSLHGDSSGHSIYAPEFYRDIAYAPRLRTLSMSGNFGNDRYDDRYATVRPISSELERISPITEMSFSNCSDGFNVTAQLLRLPKHLKRVTFSAQAGCGYHTQLGLIFKAMEIQADSLEAVNLSYMDDKIGSTIDLSRFAALKTLKMSWWSLTQDPDSLAFDEALAKGLLGPALEELTFEFNINEQSQPGVNSLSEAGITWIQEFGRLAAREQTKLKHICIDFHPEECGMSDSYYPWDPLELVKDDLATRGIELHFKHPYGNKQGFLDYVKGMRDQEAEWQREWKAEEKARAKIAKDEAAKAQKGWDHIEDLFGDVDGDEEQWMPEQADFASGEFYLSEGNDIRQYFVPLET